MALSPFGAALEVRPAHAGDLEQLHHLIDRCTAATLYRRFHGAAGAAVGRELLRIATPSATHRSWVAFGPDGTIRGTSTLAWSRSGIPEAAFLVEDAWFRRGIGRSLFEALADEARRSQLDAISASVQADNQRAQRFLLAVAPEVQMTLAGGGELQARIPVLHPDDRHGASDGRTALAMRGAA